MQYRVHTRRERQDWLADVDEIPGTHIYARTLALLEVNVREAVVVGLDLPSGADISLVWDIDSGDTELDTQAAQLREARIAVARADQQLQERTTKLTAILRSKWSVRDTAVMVGLSPQRVSQL